MSPSPPEGAPHFGGRALAASGWRCDEGAAGQAMGAEPYFCEADFSISGTSKSDGGS